jgi:hypothetical protein
MMHYCLPGSPPQLRHLRSSPAAGRGHFNPVAECLRTIGIHYDDLEKCRLAFGHSLFFQSL